MILELHGVNDNKMTFCLVQCDLCRVSDSYSNLGLWCREPPGVKGEWAERQPLPVIIILF